MKTVQEIHALEERAKELRCLYRVTEAVGAREEPPHSVFMRVLDAIPEGWQRPESTSARIEYLGRSYLAKNFGPATHSMRAPVALYGTPVGFIEVIDIAYPNDASDPFLEEERKLLASIAGLLSEYLDWKQQQLFAEPAGAQREHWGWRQAFAEALAPAILRFGVRSVYLYGSTESGQAGPGSDIDLMIVFDGDAEQRRDLSRFLDGYSACLAEVARQHTGYRIEGGLLDVTLTDRDPPPAELSFMRKLAPAEG